MRNRIIGIFIVILFIDASLQTVSSQETETTIFQVQDDLKKFNE